MRVFVRMPTGGTVTIPNAEGTHTVAWLMSAIYAQDPEAHPGLQRLGFAGTEISAEETDRTLADCGVIAESELNMGLRPEVEAVVLIVGGVKHVTTLETLLSRRESTLHEMFVGMRDGERPCFPAGRGIAPGAPGLDGIVDGVALPPRPAGPLPTVRCLGDETAYIIDRDGASFGFILNYLRSGGEVALPSVGPQRRQLAIEARYFGLPDLAVACSSGPAISSLPSLAEACGVDVADILDLSGDELSELLQQQGVNLVLAKRIHDETKVERDLRWRQRLLKSLNELN
jgi:hypothetical protein